MVWRWFVINTSAFKKPTCSLCFFMILVLGEQNCDSRVGFKAKVNIEDATSRGGTFGGSTRTKIMKFEFDPRGGLKHKSCF